MTGKTRCLYLHGCSASPVPNGTPIRSALLFPQSSRGYSAANFVPRVWSWLKRLCPCRNGTGRLRSARLRVSLKFLAGGDEPFREGLLFIDTETSGLAGGTGTIAFTIGLARVEGDEIRVRQYFLTSFKAEADMLRQALTWISSARHLVSYNGKCFDVPLLVTRYRLARMANPFGHLTHIDLLHPTRTALAKNWPDCRLQTAEQYLFKLYRDDDLPSYLIPQVWAAYLRYGETRGVRGIVEHNRFDLLSLVALAGVLARVYAEPGHSYADPLAIARAHRRNGSESAALLHLQEQAQTLSEQELAWLYRRSSRWDEAVAIWKRLAARGVLQAIERLAKYFEHTRRDYQSAVVYSHALLSQEMESAAHRKRLSRVRAKFANLSVPPDRISPKSAV